MEVIDKQEIDSNLPPLKILEQVHVEGLKLLKLVMNRLPNFDDFIWEKFEEIDKDVNPSFWDMSIQEKDKNFFWVVGKNDDLKIMILYFIITKDPESEEFTKLIMKDGSILLVENHNMYLNVGASKSWIGNKIPCYIIDPLDEEMICYVYLYDFL